MVTLEDTLFWTGHSGFYIKAKGKTIFIDPFRIGSGITGKADLILITHAHFDHCDPESVRMVMKPGTEVMGPADCLESLKIKDGKAIKPYHSEIWNGISVSAVPAYNIRPERLEFHPKKNGWVGYVLNVWMGEGDFKIYHAGDTDFIDEMKGFSKYGIDVSLLPVGGTYTMDVDEAIEAAKAIASKNTVPMHYKNLLGKDGSKSAEERFKKKVSGAYIMKEVQESTYSF